MIFGLATAEKRGIRRWPGKGSLAPHIEQWNEPIPNKMAMARSRMRSHRLLDRSVNLVMA